MNCKKCGKSTFFYKVIEYKKGEILELYRCGICEYNNTLDDLKYGKKRKK